MPQGTELCSYFHFRVCDILHCAHFYFELSWHMQMAIYFTYWFLSGNWLVCQNEMPRTCYVSKCSRDSPWEKCCQRIISRIALLCLCVLDNHMQDTALQDAHLIWYTRLWNILNTRPPTKQCNCLLLIFKVPIWWTCGVATIQRFRPIKHHYIYFCCAIVRPRIF